MIGFALDFWQGAGVLLIITLLRDIFPLSHQLQSDVK